MTESIDSSKAYISHLQAQGDPCVTKISSVYSSNTYMLDVYIYASPDTYSVLITSELGK